MKPLDLFQYYWEEYIIDEYFRSDLREINSKEDIEKIHEKISNQFKNIFNNKKLFDHSFNFFKSFPYEIINYDIEKIVENGVEYEISPSISLIESGETLLLASAKNKFTANWVKHYRIINGPIPLYLPCYQGKPAWFNDIPFPLEFSKSFDFINILKKFNFQHKEKVYYNNPSNKTKPKGSYINNIYIFNTQTEEMKLIETECS